MRQEMIEQISKQILMDRNMVLTENNKTLINKIKTSKIFMFMVIHDLKNPTVSLKNGIDLVLNNFSFIDNYKNYQDQMVIQKEELDKLRTETKIRNSIVVADNSQEYLDIINLIRK